MPTSIVAGVVIGSRRGYSVPTKIEQKRFLEIIDLLFELNSTLSIVEAMTIHPHYPIDY